MKKFTLSASVLATLALAGCQIEDGATQYPFGSGADNTVSDIYTLKYSFQADRSSGAAVQNASLESDGRYYFYLDTTNTTAGTVQFFINGTHVNSDSNYPYDLNGGSRSSANVQDMTWFEEGSNTLLVKVEGEIVSSSEFTVETGSTVSENPDTDPEPEPQPEPEPEPEPTPEEPAPAPSYSLAFSEAADRSGPASVDGLEFDLYGSYFFFLETGGMDVGTVEFLVNGQIVQTDSSYPYDMAGGSRAEALAQSMDVFAEGVNTVMVTVNDVIVARGQMAVSALTQPEPAGVTLYWNSPLKRENGSDLTLAEIGGYEIRYRLAGTADEFESLIIDDGAADQHLFEGLAEGEYEFQIAVFDTNGMYSDFVTAQ